MDNLLFDRISNILGDAFVEDCNKRCSSINSAERWYNKPSIQNSGEYGVRIIYTGARNEVAKPSLLALDVFVKVQSFEDVIIFNKDFTQEVDRIVSSAEGVSNDYKNMLAELLSIYPPDENNSEEAEDTTTEKVRLVLSLPIESGNNKREDYTEQCIKDVLKIAEYIEQYSR